jgi:hypothetical protein
MHDKEHTTANCTVNALCRVLFIVTHDNSLPCVEIDARQTLQKKIKKARASLMAAPAI